MHRRNILKFLLAAPVLMAIPLTAIEPQILDFDPSKTYGDWVVLNDRIESMPDGVIQKIIDVLCIDAEKVLPDGTEFGIWIQPNTSNDILDPFSDISTAGWRYPYQENSFVRRFVMERHA